MSDPEKQLENRQIILSAKSIDSFRDIFSITSIAERFSDSSVVQRLIHGTFWSLLGTFATRIFSFTSTVIIARLLGKENYGVLAMILSTFGMFGIFAGFSLGITTTKYLSEFRQKDPLRAGRILSLTNTTAFLTGGMILGGIVATAPWIAGELLNKPELGSIVRVGGLLLFINALNEVQVGSLAGFEAFKSIAKINFWQGLLTPLLVIPLVFYAGVPGAIYAQSLIAAIGMILCRNAVRIECRKFDILFRRFTLSAFIEEKAILWKFSVPAMTSGLMMLPAVWICNMMLVRQQNGYAELGLFNAANQWRLIIAIIPQILASIMLPIFSEIHGRNNREDFRQALNINLSLTWSFALPLTIALVILREPLSALFGKQYAGMSPIIVVLMFTAFLNIVNNVIGTALAGTGKMWLGTLFNIGWATVLIIGTRILVPVLGGKGMAIAYLIAYLLHTGWQMVYTDLILAPKVISRKHLLIILTFASVIPIVTMTYIGYQSIFMNMIVLAVSFIPLVKLGIDKIVAVKACNKYVEGVDPSVSR